MAILGFAQLPVVLVGPILRRVAKTSVAVWVALKQPSSVTLVVTDGATAITGAHDSKTVKVGENLYIVLVELTVPDSAPFLEDRVYHYDLSFGTLGTLKTPAVFRKSGPPGQLIGLAYNGDTSDLPSFVIPRKDLDKVRIAQGSCRKPHADSIDALVLLDDALQASVTNPSSPRPQQLLLTGDQIYADDVADSLLVMIRETANLLIGQPPADGGPLLDPASAGPGQRQAFAESIGLTSEKPFQKSHLITFAEYCAMYLLTWSDAIWAGTQPNPQLSTFEQVYGRPSGYIRDGQEFLSAEGQEFKRENEALTSFYRSLPRARRALANIATYMALDDHEVCDDLFINREWITRIFGSSPKLTPAQQATGRAVVRNGLLTYALFQAQGNLGIDATFESLRTNMTAWANAGLASTAAQVATLSSLVGLPTGAPPTNGHYPRDASALSWHFQLKFDNYEILVLDGRTRRSYPEGVIAPAALIRPELLTDQIPASAPTWADPNGGVTFVVFAGPWTSLSFLEGKQLGAKAEDDAFVKDVELMHFNSAAYDAIFARLAAREPRKARIAVLCGDVHHAYAKRIQYWSRSKNPLDGTAEQPPQPNWAAFAELISSALKNQGVPIFASSLALHHSGFRANQREMRRLGWLPGNAGSFSAGTGQAFVGDGELAPASWSVPVVNGVAVTELKTERDVFASLATSTQGMSNLAWQMHRQLIPGDNVPVSTTQPDLADLLAAFFIVLFNYIFGYIFVGCAGREIVGVNNIGFISLNPAQAGQPLAVVQELTWLGAPRDTLYAAQLSVNPQDLMGHKKVTREVVPLELTPLPPFTGIEF